MERIEADRAELVPELAPVAVDPSACPDVDDEHRIIGQGPSSNESPRERGLSLFRGVLLTTTPRAHSGSLPARNARPTIAT